MHADGPRLHESIQAASIDNETFVSHVYMYVCETTQILSNMFSAPFHAPLSHGSTSSLRHPHQVQYQYST